MHLTKLILKNFRCFESFEIMLHPELTVLIAPNGSGKSTVLDAARVALSPFVKGFDLGSQVGKSASIQISDVRLAMQENGNMEHQPPGSIKATGHWSSTSPEQSWEQTRKIIKPGTNTLADASTKKLTAFAQLQQEHVRGGQVEVTLPLVSYLGTSRLWYEGRFSSVAEDVALDTSSFSRTSGYQNCLSYTSSFKTFTKWYGWVWRSYREEQLLALESNTPLSATGQRFASVIEVVKNAVNALLTDATGWRDLQYRSSQNQQLVMQHAEFGMLPVEMLSDGVRNTISMVADIAFRACKLNPHLRENAALQTPGLVLIDEVDMFLHPSWQQTIIASLRRSFPKIQFIVTTHSPQVLSTLPRENIRVLGRNEAGFYAAIPEFSPLAHESGDALAKVMGTNREPPLPLQTSIHQFEQLVRAGQEQSAEATQLRTVLDQAGYQIHESDLVTWRFLAARKAAQGAKHG